MTEHSRREGGHGYERVAHLKAEHVAGERELRGVELGEAHHPVEDLLDRQSDAGQADSLDRHRAVTQALGPVAFRAREAQPQCHRVPLALRPRPAGGYGHWPGPPRARCSGTVRKNPMITQYLMVKWVVPAPEVCHAGTAVSG